MPDDKPADKAWNHVLERYVVFLRDVIEPAVCTDSTPVDAAVWQTVDPVPFAVARGQNFTPISLGFTWGPAWSTAWFRVRATVPSAMAGRRVVFRFSTDTEALVWQPVTGSTSGGVPMQGMDVNRDALTLFDIAAGGEAVELYVEAACNHAFGHKGLQWDPPEIHRRWNSGAPGYFEKCELAVLDERVQRLKWVYSFAVQLAKELPSDSARAQGLHAALRQATNSIRDNRVAADAPGAIEVLERVLSLPASGSATNCHAVGHAHIDTAWLWPLRETRRKCLRTFSNVLRIMDRYPEFVFLCSQAQQYEYVEQDSPELFEQIKRRVAEGRWEPGGAMWIEPDCTCPSGESLVRQILFADRYWRERFGDERGKQRFLYLPDTFGFPAQLPQIMKLAGLDTFITNKLHWNSHNVFPQTTFIWRGLDDSEVLGHNTPGMDYNAINTPRELLRGERTHKNKDLASADEGPVGARWLQPFGYGDGGGGPTEWSLEFARLAENCDGLPRVRLSSLNAFLDGLHADVALARKRDPASVHVHSGELYLELHRGTYTTHAKMKQGNAQSEELLRRAEELAFGGPTALEPSQANAIKARLDSAWKLVLLNQFHDILPGSSITWVYEDAARDYARVREIAQGVIDEVAPTWGAVAAKSTRAGSEAACHAVERGTSVELCCGDRRVVVTDGQIAELLGVSLGEGFSSLGLFDDRPRLWDAWDIDEEFIQAGDAIRGGWSRVNASSDAGSPSSASVSYERTIGRGSTIRMTFELRPGEGFVRVHVRVDWREEHRLLKWKFMPRERGPVVLGTQFGERAVPRTRNNSIERAAFEWQFQRSVRVLEGVGRDRIFAIIAPEKYGVSVTADAVYLSLLRSTRYPDPLADIGVHEFSVGLAIGSKAEIDLAEEAMCRPQPGSWRMLETELRVESIKRAEVGDEVIVRLLNACDHRRSASVKWNVPVSRVRVFDLLERSRSAADTSSVNIEPDGHVRITCRAWEIVTLAVTRGS
jgi:alpha-mannosidase